MESIYLIGQIIKLVTVVIALIIIAPLCVGAVKEEISYRIEKRREEKRSREYWKTHKIYPERQQDEKEQ